MNQKKKPIYITHGHGNSVVTAGGKGVLWAKEVENGYRKRLFSGQ